MTPPREIRPGQRAFISVRAVNRSFRFVPNRRVRETIWFCFAAVASQFRGQIAFHEFFWMSNHFHIVLTDVAARLPDFMQQLDSLLSRALNALRGIRGTNFEKGYNLVVVTSDDKLVDHCVYTLTNACAAHLVERAHHWKGVSSLDLDYGVPIRVHRPKHGLWSRKPSRAGASENAERATYRGRSKFPEVVEFTLERPEVMPQLSDDRLRALIRKRVAEKERELIAERKRTGTRVLGWRRVVQQDFWAVPVTGEQYFQTVPTHSGNRWARVEAQQRRRGFLAAYYEALARFVGGLKNTVFPEGTWLMKRRYGVSCCPLPAT